LSRAPPAPGRWVGWRWRSLHTAFRGIEQPDRDQGFDVLAAVGVDAIAAAREVRAVATQAIKCRCDGVSRAIGLVGQEEPTGDGASHRDRSDVVVHAVDRDREPGNAMTRTGWVAVRLCTAGAG